MEPNQLIEKRPWMRALYPRAASATAPRTPSKARAKRDCGCSERAAMKPDARAARESTYREFQQLEKTGHGSFQ